MVSYICPKVRIADLVEVTVSPTDVNYWPVSAILTKRYDVPYTDET